MIKTKIHLWIQPSRHRPWISVGPPRVDINTDHSRPWPSRAGKQRAIRSAKAGFGFLFNCVYKAEAQFFLTSAPPPTVRGRHLGRLNCQNKCWQCTFLKTTPPDLKARSENQPSCLPTLQIQQFIHRSSPPVTEIHVLLPRVKNDLFFSYLK